MALLVAGGIWTWDQVIKDRVIPKRFGVVQDGMIYRSGQLSSALVKRTLQKHGIRRIVDLTSIEPADPDERAEKRAAAELGVEISVFTLKGDGTGDIHNYARAVEAIFRAQQAGQPVLVHCAAGAQRTGGVIAAWRLLVERKDPSFVLKELRRYGWDPKDDTVLLEYLNSHMAELAQLLHESGVIDPIPIPLPELPVRTRD
jgi:protein tyrosine phosphatase (PTP) superfamily phosphohydrolase (DUF442 family)